MPKLRLGQRDFILLEALAIRVRLISQRQAANAFWEGHAANARRRLKQMVAAGFLSRSSVLSLPLPEMTQPVVRWQPGQNIPDSHAVAYRLQQRWKFKTLIPTIVYSATGRTIAQFGGRNRPAVKVTQATHDLGLTATWLRYLEQDQKKSSFWVGEDILAPSRINQKLPDAALVDHKGRPALLVEFGGSYAAPRVTDFHDDAAFRNMPYHLW